jgi:hypothetical protein
MHHRSAKFENQNRGEPHNVPPKKSLQRAVTDKVLGRGRPSAERTRALRARVLKTRLAAAELNRWATDSLSAATPSLAS